ncbi:MAG: tetratricopeptide repeat protein [Bacteroidales bacterium]|nr:tetratricopeptide repeat protein [Bacteroidales bacterium]
MKKLAFIVGLCIIAAGTSFAQKKALKDANSERKAKNFDVARSLIQEALNHPQTQNEAETWYVAGMIENDQFDVEKVKELSGEKPDSDKMYPALDRILPYFIKSDSLDMLPDEKGRVKSKYRKDIKTIMQANWPYYYNAANYYYDKGDFKNTFKNFKLYGDIPKLAMFEGEPFQAEATIEGDTIKTTVRYYAGLAAIMIPDRKAAIEIFEDIKDYGIMEDQIYQQLATQYHHLQDTVNYLRILRLGADKFPNESYYLLNLINANLAQGNIDEAEDFILKAIDVTPDNPQLYDVLGLVYEHKKDVDKAITTIKKALAIDPDNAEALSHLGRLYYNLGVEKRANAHAIEDRTAYDKEIEEVNGYFKESIPYFQKALELNSEDKEAVFALRNMYYSLGMNEEYEKMDKIFSEQQ